MAVIYRSEFRNGRLGLWNIVEEEDELLQLAGLSKQDQETFSSFKASQRRKEWLAIRALLREMTASPVQINYYQDGRPYLTGSSYHISISHTKGYAAIILHEEQIPGLDIELESRSAEKVATRILSPEELESCEENGGYSNKKLLIHWCAKETIFKMVPDHAVSYLKQIRINLINPVTEELSFTGAYSNDSSKISFDLFYRSFNELIMIWGWKSLAD
jgi:phosphopantetheinyl transferase